MVDWTWKHLAEFCEEVVKLSARLPHCNFHDWVNVDTGGQTNDLWNLNTLNLTIQCWQPVGNCWVANGRFSWNGSLYFSGFLKLCKVTFRLLVNFHVLSLSNVYFGNSMHSTNDPWFFLNTKTKGRSQCHFNLSQRFARISKYCLLLRQWSLFILSLEKRNPGHAAVHPKATQRQTNQDTHSSWAI